MWSTLLDRGRQTLVLWPVKQVTSSRRVSTEYQADLDNPIRLRATISGDRSQIADLQGQVDVEVIRVTTRSYPTRMGGTWSRCELDGVEFDLSEPPRYVKGVSRATSHWEIKLRSRANLDPSEPGPVWHLPLIERRTS